jgi:hypothetical protein
MGMGYLRKGKWIETFTESNRKRNLQGGRSQWDRNARNAAAV